MDSLLNIPTLLCATVTTLGYIMLTDTSITQKGGSPFELDDSTYKAAMAEAIENNKYLFIKLYAPWCGYCKELAPKWHDLRDEISKNEQLRNQVKIVQINADSQKNAANHFGVKSFPTVVLFDGKKDKFYKYEGPRTVKDFKEFLNKHIV